jgi:hypothetical protein
MTLGAFIASSGVLGMTSSFSFSGMGTHSGAFPDMCDCSLSPFSYGIPQFSYGTVVMTSHIIYYVGHIMPMSPHRGFC